MCQDKEQFRYLGKKRCEVRIIGQIIIEVLLNNYTGHFDFSSYIYFFLVDT